MNTTTPTPAAAVAAAVTACLLAVGCAPTTDTDCDPSPPHPTPVTTPAEGKPSGVDTYLTNMGELLYGNPDPAPVGRYGDWRDLMLPPPLARPDEGTP